MASRTIAVARCAVTVSAELFMSTVTLPRYAWNPTMSSAATEPTTSERVRALGPEGRDDAGPAP